MQHTALLVLVIAVAVSFDFTNGFHDTANAMATSIATGALKPKVAVALSGVLNLVGAFLSVSVAATIASGIVDSAKVTLPIIFAGLLGAIAWNVFTWYVGMPSSSSHALVGGVLGRDDRRGGNQRRQRLLDPVEGDRPGRPVAVHRRPRGRARHVRGVPHLATAPAGRGGADAHHLPLRPARVGVPGVARARHERRAEDDGRRHPRPHRRPRPGQECRARRSGSSSCAGSRSRSAPTSAAGGSSGRSDTGLVDIEAPQGFAAETASAAVLLISTHGGAPLSTTHITTGSVIGSGLGKRAAQVKWGVAGRMVVAWVLTIPAAAVTAGVIGLVTKNGNAVGVAIVTVLAAGVLATVWLRSRRNPVTADNVNAEADGGSAPLVPAGA